MNYRKLGLPWPKSEKPTKLLWKPSAKSMIDGIMRVGSGRFLKVERLIPSSTPLNLNTFLVILRLRSSNRINVSFICETQALIATQNCLAFRYGVTQKKQQSRLSGFIHSFLYAWIKELGRCCGNPEEAYVGLDFRGALVVLPRV